MSLQPNLMTPLGLVGEINFAVGYLSDVATFGQNLKRLRKAAGYRFAKELAAELGVTPPVVSAWENDTGGLPETPTLFKLAKAVRCSVEDLLDGIDPDYDTARAKETPGVDVTIGTVPAPPALSGSLGKEFEELWNRLDEHYQLLLINAARSFAGLPRAAAVPAKRKDGPYPQRSR